MKRFIFKAKEKRKFHPERQLRSRISFYSIQPRTKRNSRYTKEGTGPAHFAQGRIKLGKHILFILILLTNTQLNTILNTLQQQARLDTYRSQKG